MTSSTMMKTLVRPTICWLKLYVVVGRLTHLLIITLPIEGGAGKGSAEVVGDSTIIVFDNVPLDQMLPQIADYYHVAADTRNSDARQLRFHFVWKPEDKIEVLIKKLNHFERLKVELKSNKIVVE